MNQNKTNDNDDEAAREILRYLAENPESKDTLEGIADWWLLKQRISEAVRDVSTAIRRLVKQELLIQSRLPGKMALYGVNPERLDEIRNLIKKNAA